MVLLLYLLLVRKRWLMACVSLVKMWFLCHPHLGSATSRRRRYISAAAMCRNLSGCDQRLKNLSHLMSKMTHLMMMKTSKLAE